MFSPGWEVDRTGGTAGLCQPVERDLFDCHLAASGRRRCPISLNRAPDWVKKMRRLHSKTGAKLDVIFP
jgi:hypothetical protein